MLKSTLNLKHNVDISKYCKLIAYLKKQNVGYQPKKSSIFTKENIENFLKNAPFEFLPHKVALVIGISGACRSDELFKMKTGDIDLQQHRAIIVLPNTKTYQPRSFVVANTEWVEILKCYIDLRKNVEGDRFFLQLRHGKLTKQPYGHNSIAQLPKKIASYLQLNNVNTYTGHCFRRTSATLLVNSGGDIINLKKLGGWRSSTVAESYVGSSLDGQLKIASMLSTEDTTSMQNMPNISVPGPSSQQFHFSNTKENLHQGISLHVEGRDNTTINIYFNKTS
ncbi:hypothetical protein RN001_002335 [Aquatica leii]|uniref:Tyr recombinase domain-containing protein n=1 Tax=Aquatica leii TaxID=1421715 RepID=A0AAN7SLS6_9COLE|nr:hypothetical protein RN001_002335 [Aquatica leii]